MLASAERGELGIEKFNSTHKTFCLKGSCSQLEGLMVEVPFLGSSSLGSQGTGSSQVHKLIQASPDRQQEMSTICAQVLGRAAGRSGRGQVWVQTGLG